MRRYLGAQPVLRARSVASYVVVPVVARRLGQDVAEDLGEPCPAPRPVEGGVAVVTLLGHAHSPFCSASACASADGGLLPPPEPPPP